MGSKERNWCKDVVGKRRQQLRWLLQVASLVPCTARVMMFSKARYYTSIISVSTCTTMAVCSPG